MEMKSLEEEEVFTFFCNSPGGRLVLHQVILHQDEDTVGNM